MGPITRGSISHRRNTLLVDSHLQVEEQELLYTSHLNWTGQNRVEYNVGTSPALGPRQGGFGATTNQMRLKNPSGTKQFMC